MRIILLKDVRGVGQKGNVKNVSDGYALNMLIPRGFAEQATAQKITEHAEWQKAAEESREKREEEYASLAKRLDGSQITISVAANKLGKLYRHVTPEAIAEQIKKELDVVVPPDAIVFAEPLRKVGESTVRVRLGKSNTELKVQVADK